MAVVVLLGVCPYGGLHRWTHEDSTSGVLYRCCEKCGAIVDEREDV